MGNKLIRFYLLNFWVEISFIQVGFLGSILPLNVKFFLVFFNVCCFIMLESMVIIMTLNCACLTSVISWNCWILPFFPFLFFFCLMYD